jgi:hypothetical protein
MNIRLNIHNKRTIMDFLVDDAREFFQIYVDFDFEFTKRTATSYGFIACQNSAEYFMCANCSYWYIYIVSDTEHSIINISYLLFH